MSGLSVFAGSRVLLLQQSAVLRGLGDTKKFRQRSVGRTRKLDATLVKEKRRELVEQGLMVDHLVTQAYEELRAEGFRFDAKPRQRQAAKAAAATSTQPKSQQ
jgi:hypothetical protein